MEKSGDGFEKRFETDFSRTDGRAQRTVVQRHRGLRGVLQVIRKSTNMFSVDLCLEHFFLIFYRLFKAIRYSYFPRSLNS